MTASAAKLNRGFRLGVCRDPWSTQLGERPQLPHGVPTRAHQLTHHRGCVATALSAPPRLLHEGRYYDVKGAAHFIFCRGDGHEIPAVHETPIAT